MKTIKTLTAITFLFSTLICSAQWGSGKKIKGNGNITTVTRTTSDYEGVKFAGSLDFKLVEGKEGNITIKGDSNLLDYVITEVKSNTLIVKLKKGINISYKNSIIVTVPYESINSISLAGSGDVVNSGTLSEDKLNISLAGSGDINLTIASKDVKSNIAGSGDIELKGRTERLNAKIAGSGDFDSFGLKSTDTEVSVTGSGDANVTCSGNLKAKVTGSGDISYRGNPTNKDSKVVGSGSISRD